MDAEYKNPEHENFDHWLDAAVRARVDAEPRMGLEERVLATLATEHPRTVFSWMPLAAAIAVAVAVSATLVVTYSRLHSGELTAARLPIIQSTRTSPPPPMQASSTTPDRQQNGKITARRVAKSGGREVPRSADREHALPMLASFPAAAPRTQQERLLAEFAGGANAKQLINFSETLVPLNDIEISSLQIEPLDREDSSPH